MYISNKSSDFKKEQVHIKHYEFNLLSSIKFKSVHSYYEYKDLEDLNNASIKKLEISDYINLTHKTKFYLKELLRNTNIKKLDLIFENMSRNYQLIVYVSNLLRKNTTIKEIEIYFKWNNKINFNIVSWINFFKENNDRIIGVKGLSLINENSEMNKLLYSNENLKEIELYNYNLIDSKVELLNLLKYILSTNKYLNKFEILMF